MKQKTRLDGVHAGVLAAAAAAFLLRTLRLDDWHTGGLAHPSVFAVFVHDRDGDVAGAENLRVGREHRQTVRRGPRPPPHPPLYGAARDKSDTHRLADVDAESDEADARLVHPHRLLPLAVLDPGVLREPVVEVVGEVGARLPEIQQSSVQFSAAK